MKLTAYQKRNLAALVYMRDHTPTIWSTLMFRPKSWLPYLLIMALSVFCYFCLDTSMGLLAIGLMIGSVLRIIAHARFAVMAWPVTKEVVDWSKVEALQQENQT